MRTAEEKSESEQEDTKTDAADEKEIENENTNIVIDMYDYLPKDIYGNLHIANNSFLRGSDVPKKSDTCNIAGYVATHRNYYPFSEKNFKKCKIKFNKGNLFEGILDDIDVAIEKL